MSGFYKADLIRLVNVAQAPVSLVIATSIFLHMLTSRYVPMYDRLRALTDEYRKDPRDHSRQSSIQQQIRLYEKRIKATQAASVWLNVAVVCFLGTVCASATTIIYPQNVPLRLAGLISMALGILLLLIAIAYELYEDRFSRAALRIELSEFPEIATGSPAGEPNRVSKRDRLISATTAGSSFGRRP